MLKNNKLTNKIIKTIAICAVALGLSTSLIATAVSAATAPTIKAQIKVNGVLTNLGNDLAESEVYMTSDTPCMWYLGGNTVSDSYTTNYVLEKGYSLAGFQINCISATGDSSNYLVVKIDLNQPPLINISAANSNAASVRLNSMKSGNWVVNGVKQTEATDYIVITGDGNYSVSQVDSKGLSSSTITFSIPYKPAAVTTTTTKKPVVTTKKPNVTNKPNTTTPVAKVELSAIGLNDNMASFEDVIINANADVYFIVDGKKEAKLAKTITISAEGEHTVSAVNAKNVASEEIKFNIDRTAPEVKLEVNGLEVTAGIFEAAVTITSDTPATFLVNEEVKASNVSTLTIEESGTFTVQVKDDAGNITSVDFVVNMPKVEEPKTDEGKGSNTVLYIVGGIIAVIVIAGGAYFGLQWKKKKDEENGSNQE